MKQHISLFFEKVILNSLSTIVPLKKGLILFGSGFNAFSDNPKFLFLHFNQHKFYTPVWISPNRSEITTLRAQGYSCSYKWSFKTFWLVLRTHIFIISHKVGDVFPIVHKRSIVINLWHGTPIKKIGLDSLQELIWINNFKKSGRILPYDRWNYFITASSDTIFIFQGAMQLQNKIIKPLGQPRTDRIYANIINNTLHNKILNKIEPSNKFGGKTKVLYAPTFRNNNKTTSEIKLTLINIDNAIDKNKGQIILFKPHPLDKIIFDEQFFKSLNNIINVSAEDTQDLLLISDILITDYSSIIFDFMITGRPIISYIFDYDEYVAENGGLYFSFEEIGTATAINSSTLISLIMDPSQIRNMYNISKFNTIDSCDRILNFVNRLISETD